MRRLVITIMAICILSINQGPVAQEVLKLIRVQNPKGDLTGENWRVRIFLRWPAQDGAKTYIVYRALSISEPWVEMVRKDEEEVRDFGGYEDVTDLAQTNSLCYKVEAVNEIRQLIRVYEAVCVPEYV